MGDYGYDLSKVWVIVNRTPIANRYASIDYKIVSDDRCLFRPDLINGGLIRRPLPTGAKRQTLKTPIPLSDDLAVAIATNPTEAGGLKHFLLTSILSTISNISKSAAAP